MVIRFKVTANDRSRRLGETVRRTNSQTSFPHRGVAGYRWKQSRRWIVCFSLLAEMSRGEEYIPRSRGRAQIFLETGTEGLFPLGISELNLFSPCCRNFPYCQAMPRMSYCNLTDNTCTFYLPASHISSSCKSFVRRPLFRIVDAIFKFNLWSNYVCIDIIMTNDNKQIVIGFLR